MSDGDINEIVIKQYEYNRIMSEMNQRIKESMVDLEKVELKYIN